MKKKGTNRGWKTSTWTVKDEGNQSPREAAALPENSESKEQAGGPRTEQIKAMVEARDYHKQVRARVEVAHKLELQHAAATKIQSWFRMCRHAKFGGLAFLWRKRMHVQGTAILVLQRVYRGHLARHSDDFRLRLEFRRLEHNCAIHIQAVTRGHLDRKAVRDALQKAEDDRVKRAVTIIQRYTRGYRVRKLNNRARMILRAKVRTIENFHINYFQPWYAKQMDILQGSLEKIVIVQSRIRRFLAITHSRHLRRARARNFAHGISLLLYALMMTLFMTATIYERSSGDFIAAGRAVGKHLHSTSPHFHMPPSPLQHHPFSPSVISHPHQFWEWLEHSYLPRYRSLFSAPTCDEVRSTSRACAPSDHDRFPGHVIRQLIIRQKRSRLTRIPLPFANSKDIDQACTAQAILTGGVCGRYPSPEIPSVVTSTDAPNGTATASSLRGAEAVGGGLKFSAGWEEKSSYGSRFMPFTFQGSIDGEATEGSYGWYGDGGYILGSEVGGRLAVESEEATGCGVPCEGGLRRFALTEWVDGRTRMVQLLTAVVLEQVNALVLSKTVLELSPAGAVLSSERTDATRIRAYGGGGGNWWRGAGAEAWGRITPEVLLFVGGALHFGWAVVTGLVRIEATFKDGRGRVRFKRKHGSVAHRLRGVLRGWVLVDLAAVALLLLALILRGAAQGEASRLFGATGEAEASDGDRVQSWSMADTDDGGVGWRSLRTLSGIHMAGDGVVAVAGVLLWSRAIVQFLPLLPAARALPAAFARAAVPLFSSMMVLVPVLVCCVHVTLLVASSADQRLASSVLAARTVLDSLLKLLETEEGWDALSVRGLSRAFARTGARGAGAGGDHRWGSALREPVSRGGEADGLVIGVMGAVGLVCAGLFGAVVVAAAGEEFAVEKDKRHRPWLYRDGRGNDQYKPWQFPPFVELRRVLGNAMVTKRQQRIATALVRAQARQLNLKISRRPKGKRAFEWMLLKEADAADKLRRQITRELRVVSRQLAWEERAMVSRTERVCNVMEEGADELLELTAALFHAKFHASQLSWPHAIVSDQQRAEAARRREEEELERRQALVRVPRRRFEALDRQLRGVEQQLGKLADQAALSLSAEHLE